MPGVVGVTKGSNLVLIRMKRDMAHALYFSLCTVQTHISLHTLLSVLQSSGDDKVINSLAN